MIVNSFLEYLKFERNYSEHTITAYKKDINSFFEFCLNEFEIENLVEVNYSQIRSWIVVLVDAGISNNSINRKISSLKSFYKFLQKTEQVRGEPFSETQSVKGGEENSGAFYD